jgi:hypothetical protein
LAGNKPYTENRTCKCISGGICNFLKGSAPCIQRGRSLSNGIHFFDVADFAIFYLLGFWSLLPQNTNRHNFYYVDLSMQYSLYILRGIMDNEQNIGKNQLGILIVGAALRASPC